MSEIEYFEPSVDDIDFVDVTSSEKAKEKKKVLTAKESLLLEAFKHCIDRYFKSSRRF